MTRWHGKLLGFVAGFMLTRRPLGGLVGALLGHAFDEGWLKSRVPGVSAADTSDAEHLYRVFGLHAGANEAEVDAAYKRLISQCHPDKHPGAAPAQREQAEQRTRELNAAYGRLKRLRRK